MMRRKTKQKDCGCGGGKNCITKAALTKFVKSELKNLDCGCGCKGEKGFCGKYGMTSKQYVGGNILTDCPPGWRNDGLTCVEPCAADEKDDGLTCRKKCPDGYVDDGLTCRKPITSSMNECPAGSKDIAGTCWGPVRKDCVDDCFKHPAPGCRTYECGRLRGAFGEDWGPKWCTDCNLRCGQTCWDVQGITKQLHERNLKVSGGEVILQAIRSKQIRGRVDFSKLDEAIAKGLKDLFEGNIDLAAAFDPERNGVNAAFRKFGDDIKGALNEIENGIKEGFKKMGDAAKAAFEELARNAERDFKQFGDDFVKKMKDPDFWVEFSAILAEVALTAAATIATATGVGAAFAPGLLAAAAMAGPAIRMIADGARGRPIDALDIVELAVAGASAAVPGLSGMTKTAVKAGTQAAKIVVAGVKLGQAAGVIPESCIVNCPPPAKTPATEPPIVPQLPPVDPPPAGQKSDDEILALAPACTFFRVVGKPTAPEPCNNLPRATRNLGEGEPPYYSPEAWIAKYRLDHYGTNPTGPGGELENPDDENVEDETNVEPDLPPVNIGDIEIDFDLGDNLPELDLEAEPIGDLDLGDNLPELDLEAEPIGDLDLEAEPIGDLDLGDTLPELDLGAELIGELDLEGLAGGANPESMPLIDVFVEGDKYTNPWGTMTSMKPKANIPSAHNGEPFNIDCYIRKNPEVADAAGNDKDKITTHWIEIGSKNGLDASCGPISTKEEILKAMEEKSKREALSETYRTACIATDRFWDQEKLECDGTRHADGRQNSEAAQCKKEGSHWSHIGNKAFCNKWRNLDNNIKTKKEICNTINGHWTGHACDLSKNVDGTPKNDADYCTGFDNYYDPKTNNCDVRKDRNGRPKSEEKMCEEDGNYWGSLLEIDKAWYGGDGRNVDITDLIRSLVVGNKLPAFNTNDFVRQHNLGDPAPYKRKALVIQYKNSHGGIDQTLAWEGESTQALTVNSTGIGCHISRYPDGRLKGRQAYCQTTLHGSLHNDRFCDGQLGRYPTTYGQMETVLREKRLIAANEDKDLLRIKGGNKSGKSLTLYYANWCPHCKPLIPMFKKLKVSGVQIRMLEQAENREFKVQGYPTIVYRNGNSMEMYNGPRTKSDIINFLKNKL